MKPGVIMDSIIRESNRDEHLKIPLIKDLYNFLNTLDSTDSSRKADTDTSPRKRGRSRETDEAKAESAKQREIKKQRIFL